MTSAIDRFRKRQNRAMVIDVGWPTDKPVLVFKVNRFAQAEHNAAQKDALDATAKRAGVEEGAERMSFFLGEYCEALPKYIKRHVKNWVHTPTDGSEPIQFSPGALEAIVSEMTRDELREFGAAYLLASDDEEKKKDGGGSSETASASA